MQIVQYPVGLAIIWRLSYLVTLGTIPCPIFGIALAMHKFSVGPQVATEIGPPSTNDETTSFIRRAIKDIASRDPRNDG